MAVAVTCPVGFAQRAEVEQRRETQSQPEGLGLVWEVTVEYFLTARGFLVEKGMEGGKAWQRHQAVQRPRGMSMEC